MEAQLSRFAALNKTGLDVALDALFLLAEGAEKLGRLPFEATKILFQKGAEAVMEGLTTKI